MNTPVLGYVIKKLLNHKKKFVFISVFYLLYKTNRLRLLNRPLKKLLNIVIGFMIKRMKSQSLKAQKALEQRLKMEIAITEFITKELARNKNEIGDFFAKLYPTDQLLNEIQTQKLAPDVKKQKFDELMRLISVKVLATVTTQYFYDVKHFLLVVLKNKDKLQNSGEDLKTPGNLERSTSQENMIDDQMKLKDKRDKHGPMIRNISQPNNMMLEPSLEIKQPKSQMIDEFANALFETLITDFNNYLKDEFVDRSLAKVEATKKISLEEIINVFKASLDELFYKEVVSGHLNVGSQVNSTIYLGSGEFKIMKHEKLFWRSLRDRLKHSTNNSQSVFNQILKRLRNTKYVENKNLFIGKPFEAETFTTQANFILDFVSSSYFHEASKYSAEYQLNKLFNRLAMYFRKTHGEDSLLTPDALQYGAKLLIASNSILNEEFYSKHTFLMEQQVLEKRIKFALFIIKKNDNTANTDQPETANDDLNCTLVRTVDPYSSSAQFATYLAMREKLAFEMFMYVLRDYVKQTVVFN